MAKRNNVINFAAKRRREEPKTELTREHQGSIVDEENTRRYKYVTITLFVFTTILVGSESFFALKLNVMASLLLYWAETYKSIFVEIVTIFNLIFLFVWGINKKDVKKIYFSICIFLIVVLMVSIISILELIGLALEVREKQVAESSGLSTVTVKVSTEYQKESYSSDEDIFIERLEKYYGVEKGSIPKEEVVDKMVLLIEEELNNAVDMQMDTKIPQSYTDNCYLADILYEFYFDNHDMLMKDYSDYVISELRIKILDNLKGAKDYRQLADNEYKDATNQRIIGLYCIDLSDEYVRTGDVVSAEEELLEAASWAIKSINTAAVRCDKTQMENALKVLESAEKRLNDLQGKIGESNIQKVKNCMEAYRIVINNWEIKQQ